MKIAKILDLDTILDDVAQAVSLMNEGTWRVLNNYYYDTTLVRLQKYGVLLLEGTDVYYPGDRFVVDVRLYARRSPSRMPREYDDDQEAALRWIAENTVPIEFDSQRGHPLVYFRAFISGNTPARNWEGRFDFESEYDRYRIGDTTTYSDDELNFVENVHLATPTEVGEWVRETIDRAYRDFDGDDDGGDNQPDVPFDPDNMSLPQTPSNAPVSAGNWLTHIHSLLRTETIKKTAIKARENVKKKLRSKDKLLLSKCFGTWYHRWFH